MKVSVNVTCPDGRKRVATLTRSDGPGKFEGVVEVGGAQIEGTVRISDQSFIPARPKELPATCIRVEYNPPPIPIRTCDWQAWVDGEDYPLSWGPTREKALEELAMDLEDLRDRPDLAAQARALLR